MHAVFSAPIPAPQVPGFTPRYKEDTGLRLIDQMNNSYNWQDAMIHMARNKRDETNAPGPFTRMARRASDLARYAQRERPLSAQPEPFQNIQDTFVPSSEPVDTGIYKRQSFFSR